MTKDQQDVSRSIINIGSTSDGPGGELSNFTYHYFVLDGVNCSSMEGFLQSLKFKDYNKRIEVCKLIGIDAKRAGRKEKWQDDPFLIWNGKPHYRYGPEYQHLLTRAYDALFHDNARFRMALLATGNATLTHSIGKSDPTKTILTEKEFIDQLMRLRKLLS